jgi:hypothetical protein
MNDPERRRLTQALIEGLKNQNLPAYDHKLELFLQLGRSRLGIPVGFTPELAFRFLACRVLYACIRCSSQKCTYTWVQPWQFCRMRFLCAGCAAWSHRVQADCWKSGINEVLAGGKRLSQFLELEWDAPSDPTHITEFNRYLHWVVQPRLVRGLPVGVHWLMATADDPVGREIRAVLGITSPEHDPHRGTATCFNAVDCFRGQPPLVSVHNEPLKQVAVGLADRWLPRTVRRVHGDHVSRTLAWAAGSLPLIAPQRAIELEWKYRGRHLYTSRGLLYGLASRKMDRAARDIHIASSDDSRIMPPINLPGERCICPWCGSWTSLSYEHRFQDGRPDLALSTRFFQSKDVAQ